MRKLHYMLIFLCALVSQVDADTISLSSIVPLVLKNDPTVRIMGKGFESSVYNRELLLAGTRPQIQVNKAPEYSLSGSRFSDPFNNGEITNLASQGISASMNLTQVLPTDGTLIAGISDSVTIVKKGDDVTIDQEPLFSLSVSQPVFTNGKVIDLSIYPARQSLYGDIPVTRSGLREKTAKNSGLISAFSTYASTFRLRRQLQHQNAAIELSEKLLNLSRLRAKQGSMTSRELWEEELALESMKEALLELKYALLENEQKLARSLGFRDDFSGTLLSEAIPVIEIEQSDAELAERAATANMEVLDYILAVEEAEHTGVLNNREFSSDLSVSVSVMPKYSPSRSDSDDFGASFSDFFDEDAYIAPVVSMGLSIPVYNGGRAKHQREIDKNAVEIAEANLASARRLVIDTMQNLFLRRDMLTEKLELVRSNLLLEKERLAEKQRLFELKQITPLEVEQVYLKTIEKELETWTTEADLFIISVRILDQAGYDLETLFEGLQQ